MIKIMNMMKMMNMKKIHSVQKNCKNNVIHENLDLIKGKESIFKSHFLEVFR
jgi:hypothetical protein